MPASRRPLFQALLRYLFIIKNLFLYGGFIPALWGPSLLLTVSLSTDMPHDMIIILVSFLLPLIIYSYDYYADMAKDIETNPERANLDKKLNYNLIILYVCFLIGLIIYIFNYMIILFVLTLFAMGILYASVFKKITLKIPAFKNFYLSFIWSLWGTFLIVMYNYEEVNIRLVLIFLFIYAKVLLNTIFFDIKDAKSDKKEGLKTLPAVLGIFKTITYLHVLNLLTAFILILGGILYILPPYCLLLTIFYLYVFYYLEIIKNKSQALSKKSMLADLEAIFYPLLLFFFRWIWNN
ncbi:MAG: UbiA family prenyltransferase [Euryarchaeota archaeon]|nr:UbiA family prenyltransferase [Euryarchaeota archaeon]MBU4547466.1 UbiA family prenyltransferase [Euryarchaeota archaeon]MBV1756095.1 UbiA family prenyltransferase [Methanobacterium sp.]MBV1767864.1 UbiA family prenyltransferase [Methanobacterium sp.]